MARLLCVTALTLAVTGCGDSNENAADARRDTDRPRDSAGDTSDDRCPGRPPELCPPPDPEDFDGDGYRRDVDCDDRDISSHPGAIEYPCNGVDEDCSGADLCESDRDRDGFNDGVDCAPDDPTIYPGAPSIPCNGIDESCVGHDACAMDADGDRSFRDPDGTGDCNDMDPTIYPLAPEAYCDGIDQNCDGRDCCMNDEDMDAFPCRDDCDDNDQQIYPGASRPLGRCESRDYDCSGSVEDDEVCI